jgi:glycosyltransferase involved in cell wall biosynthesis
MAQVRAAVPNAELLIVGTGEASKAVKDAIAQLDLRTCVHFTDAYVPLSEALNCIADADVGIVPNEISEYTLAMLPVKLTEYATLGIPAVATALPLVLTYFGPNAVELIDRAEPGLIADALVRLARNPARRVAVADAARRFEREHGWPRYSRTLIEALGLSPSVITALRAHNFGYPLDHSLA